MHGPNKWDVELPWILLVQRAVKCSARTKFCPAMMVFGKQLELPAVTEVASTGQESSRAARYGPGC